MRLRSLWNHDCSQALYLQRELPDLFSCKLIYERELLDTQIIPMHETDLLDRGLGMSPYFSLLTPRLVSLLSSSKNINA
jgi:hypothetical protein